VVKDTATVMEHLADVDSMSEEFLARVVDVGDDELDAVQRAGRSCRDLTAEDDRARRPRWCELDDPEAVGSDEIGIQAPAEPGIELFYWSTSETGRTRTSSLMSTALTPFSGSGRFCAHGLRAVTGAFSRS